MKLSAPKVDFSMKAYSLDLRQKIVDVHAQEEISQRQLAKRFQVSLSTVQRLLKRQRNGEDLAPKAHGGGHPSRLTPEQVEKVREIVESHNDATLEELCEMMAQAENVRVSCSTMGRVVQSLGLTRKKKRFMPANDTQKEYKS
jgi:transposase